MHPNQLELSALAKSLQLVIDEAQGLAPEMGAIKGRIVNKLTLEVNFINSITGIQTAPVTSAEAGPLTHIMGEEIKRHKPVVAEDLEPTNMEKDKFIADRDNLYSQFLTLKNEQIYTKAKMPMGDSVIRAVAKKAGVENYADAKINDIFLSAIRKGIQAEKDLQKSLTDAEQKVKEHVG